MPQVEGFAADAASQSNAVSAESRPNVKQPSNDILKTCAKLEKALKRIDIDPAKLEECLQHVRNGVTRKALESSTPVNLKEIIEAPSADIQRLAATLMIHSVVHNVAASDSIAAPSA